MNLAIIDAATATENRPFFSDAVTRLAKVFPDPLDESDAVVLGYAMQQYTINFADGFILNGDDSVSMIGLTDAAVILSALCDYLNKDWEWWRSRLCLVDLPPSEFGKRLERMLGYIIRHTLVKSVSN